MHQCRIGRTGRTIGWQNDSLAELQDSSAYSQTFRESAASRLIMHVKSELLFFNNGSLWGHDNYVSVQQALA